ncbi:MAG: transcriptional regulator [Kiloniellaceae bacterium]
MSEPWLEALAAAARIRGQAAAARRIGYRPSVVSQVLNGTYKGNETAVRRAVEGALMGAVVSCPVLGEIPAHRCATIQRQAFAATTPERVRLYRACRAGCPNYRGGLAATTEDERP